MSGIAPIVLSIQACDSVVIDSLTGRTSLFNIAETITALKYPARHPNIAVFCELTNGHGTADVNIKIVDVQKEDALLGEIKTKIEFKNVKQINRCVVNFSGIEFPHEGEYRFQLFLNSELKAERRIVCRILQKKQESPNE